METLECWDIAIRNTPSLLALSRQSVPQLRNPAALNKSEFGAYVLHQFGSGRDITLIATGTEVGLAVDAATALYQLGVSVAVVSMPSWELVDAQPAEYRAKTLGNAPHIAIEAASKFGWTRYVAFEDNIIGRVGFGASAPAEELYEIFGITVEAIVANAQELTKENQQHEIFCRYSCR